MAKYITLRNGGRQFVAPFGYSFPMARACWVSALAFAASVGGTVARIIHLDDVPAVLVVSLAIGVALVVLHQVPSAFSWFTFQNSRRVRLGFWLLAATVCVVAEFAYVILLNRASS
ncbi:MAG TPA: hypothetical protein VJW76_04010 [Verrucomicrobiae bacterium]|nr:hypothetical protein [Verrucomicrobiae bacterium]